MDQLIDNRVQVVLCNPLDNSHANRVPEAEQRLVQTPGNPVVPGPHEPSALERSQQSREVFSLSRLEQDLPSTAASRSPQAAGDSVGAQLGHRLGFPDAPKDCPVGPARAGYHSVRHFAMPRAHLAEQILSPLGAPPVSLLLEYLSEPNLRFRLRRQGPGAPTDLGVI